MKTRFLHVFSRLRLLPAAIISVIYPSWARGDTTDSIVAHKPNIVERVVNYITSANEPHPEKRFDFSIIGGPYYSSDTKVGVGIVASGLYRHNPADTLTPPGNVSVYGDVSVTGYFKIGIRGDQYFRGDAWRMEYDVSFERERVRYWGAGFDVCSDDGNRVRFSRIENTLDFTFIRRVIPGLYIGPRVMLSYINGRHMERPELWRGQQSHTFTDALGIVVAYDTRDHKLNASRGVYARLDNMFAPRCFGNRYAFSSTEFAVSQYQQLWRGATLASRLHFRMTYGDTPWGLMSVLGDSYTMRGYYPGRYNDKCAADLTVEIRQHVWRRHGFVVWGGAGKLFAKPSEFNFHHILHNFGIGYRWQFKQRVNIRLDYGIGRHESGFIFQINEAF